MDSLPPAQIRFDQPGIADLTLADGSEGRAAVDVLRHGVAQAVNRGAVTVRWWAAPATATTDRTALDAGLEPTRDLLHLRVPLPASDPDPAVVTRPFTRADAEAWIDVNNRAFHWHPEQSGMTVARLEAIMAESWFDADGFLLHESDGRLAGFCWTKLHHDQDPLLGEIFVIAVDPDFHGRGLGLQLTLAGLHWLHRAGAVVGGLYVEADNTPAIAAYERIGFTLHHVQRAYTHTTGATP